MENSLRRPEGLALFVVTVLAPALSPALAQEKTDEQPRAPIPVFEMAKKGDFETFVVNVVTTKEPEFGRKLVLVFRIADAGEDSVTLKTLGSLSSPDDLPSVTFDRAKEPLISKLLADVKLDNVTGLERTDEKKTAGGREFACTRLSFVTTRVIPHERASGNSVMTDRWSLWFSAEVKGAGIVAMEHLGSRTDNGVTQREKRMTCEIAGFGNGEKADWGKLPEALGLSKEGSQETFKLPFNPLEKAREGAWEAIVETSITTGGIESCNRSVTSARVAQVTSESVTFEWETRTSKGKGVARKSYALSETPTLEDYAGLNPGEVKDLVIEDAQIVVGDRTFDGKKLSYNVRRTYPSSPGRVMRMQCRLFLSPTIPGFGNARMELSGVATDERMSYEMKIVREVVGYGHGDRVEWGKRAADIDLSGK